MPSIDTGEIAELPVLDLTTYTSAEQLSGITGIRDVAAVIVPQSLLPTLRQIPMTGVASVVPVADGVHAHVHVGSMPMGGEAMANPGGDDEALVVVGMLLITSPFEHVGFREVVVVGAVLAPRGCEDALGAGLTRVTGGVTYYPYSEGQQIRQVVGGDRRDGSVFAGAGDDLLLVAGELIVTKPVEEIGVSTIIVAGQAVLPRSAQPRLGPIMQVAGNVVWYGGDNPQFVSADSVCDQEFFELVAGRPVVFLGDVRIADDVTSAAIRGCGEMTATGTVTAPRALRSTLMVTITELQGRVVAVEDAAEVTAVGDAGGAEDASS